MLLVRGGAWLETPRAATNMATSNPATSFGYAASVPSVPVEGPYEVYFTSHDRGEPPHVHVSREKMTAKIWLEPVRIAYNLGFSRHELRRVERLVQAHQKLCLRKWYDYFGT
jgi:hypothetical protein